MPKNHKNYVGDAALKTALSQAGTDARIDDVRDLIAGVVGSATNDDAWMTLITPTPDDALREQLNALKSLIKEILLRNSAYARAVSVWKHCDPNCRTGSRRLPDTANR